MVNNQRKWLTALVLMASVVTQAATNQEYSHLLRDKKTSCGFYLAKLSSEFTGKQITSNLETANLAAKLSDFDPLAERIVAVGAPPDWMSRRKLRVEIERIMSEAGFPKAKYTAIRRIGNFIESKVGVFVHLPGKPMQRVSSLDEVELSAALTGQELRAVFEAGGSIVISGTPLIGPTRQKLEAGIKSKLSQAAQDAGVPLNKSTIRSQSKSVVWAKAFAESPRKTFTDAWHRLRSLLPYSEDMVRPTHGELHSTGQKVIMHTLFSLLSFNLKGEAMQVMVPMTVINGANSAATGTYRSFIGNWMSRDGDAMTIRTLKGIMLASFFTFDLYLARNAFNGEILKSLTEISGWSNFLAGSWVSILFQSLWRTPVSSVLHSWERWKSQSGGPDVSAWARNVGGAAEKFMTYVMTQFYILSIVLDSSFFKLIWTADNGPGLLSGNADVNSAMGQTLLMNFNVGHLAMATVGIGALAMKKHYRLFDRISPAVEWLDQMESKLYRGVTGVFKRAPVKAE